ncbi:MAG: anhydro-N-acetylmuramic acid kinase [Gammaproteobacteria bacterium]|nr:anhydro-N-acetylmuramic acid kinase [Gammaproteobacteria bacterium]
MMSGTSLDGVDTALVEFDADGGTRVVAAQTTPLPEPLHAQMHAIINEHKPCELPQLGALDMQLGTVYAETALQLLTHAGIDASAVTAIGCHGQTIHHAPDGEHPFTLQIGDANRIAAITGITTVADFRRRDMAFGGQGAPLACGFHAAIFSADDEDRVVLNLGGISNITVLNRNQEVRGFDCGPANALLDAWIKQHNNATYDKEGAWAAGGAVDQELLTRLLADEYFERSPPKSTGKEHFSLGWLTGHLLNLAIPPNPQDVQSTLAELTVTTIAADIRRYAGSCRRCIVAGGGAHNSDLLERLTRQLEPVVVQSSEHFGVSPDFVEAAAFAWLASRTLAGEPGNVPTVTGAQRSTILGAIYRA